SMGPSTSRCASRPHRCSGDSKRRTRRSSFRSPRNTPASNVILFTSCQCGKRCSTSTCRPMKRAKRTATHRRDTARRNRNQKVHEKAQGLQRRKEKSFQKNKKLRICYPENAEATQRSLGFFHKFMAAALQSRIWSRAGPSAGRLEDSLESPM